MPKNYRVIDDNIQNYITSSSVRDNPALAALRAKTEADVEKSGMMSPADQAQFLQLLLRLVDAKRVIEVGVYTGHATLAMAQALPADGELIACDINEAWTNIGKSFWQQAGVADKIDLRLVPALETLQQLLDDGQEAQFDFAFIDADKLNYARYYELSLSLVREGGLIVFDNTLWAGKSSAPDQNDKIGKALHELTLQLKQDVRVDFSLLPIACGMSVVRKR